MKLSIHQLPSFSDNNKFQWNIDDVIIYSNWDGHKSHVSGEIYELINGEFDSEIPLSIPELIDFLANNPLYFETPEGLIKLAY